MTVLEYLDEWCASLTKLSPAQREAKFFDLLPFDRGRAFNGLVDRFARAEELRNGYLRDLGDTTRACDSLKRELADTQRSLKAANGLTDEVRIRLHEVQSDAVRERANANNLGVSLNKLRLQANGWKEENEQLRKELTDVHTSHALAQADYEHVAKERDQLRKDIGRLDAQLNEAGRAIQALSSENERAKYAIEAKNRLLDSKAAETLALKEELDLLNRNYTKVLALRDKQAMDAREARFWDLIIKRGMHPNDARELLHTAETIAKGLNKA